MAATYDTTHFEGFPADGLYRVHVVGADGAETKTNILVAARGLCDAYAIWNLTPGTMPVVFRTDRESTYDKTPA